jgi:hypothetical protein
VALGTSAAAAVVLSGAGLWITRGATARAT